MPLLEKLHLERYEKTVFGAHEPARLERLIPSNRLILLLRNYHEAIPRQTKTFDGDQYVQYMLSRGYWITQYLAMLRLFDRIPKHRRYLIYYEDLITHPRKVIQGLVRFIGWPHGDLASFFEEYEAFRGELIRAYDTHYKHHMGSVTKGKKVLHHSLQFTTEERQVVDRSLEEEEPRLYKKYLRRYKVQSMP